MTILQYESLPVCNFINWKSPKWKAGEKKILNTAIKHTDKRFLLDHDDRIFQEEQKMPLRA